jgi:hypothetical protein
MESFPMALAAWALALVEQEDLAVVVVATSIQAFIPLAICSWAPSRSIRFTCVKLISPTGLPMDFARAAFTAVFLHAVLVVASVAEVMHDVITEAVCFLAASRRNFVTSMSLT